MGLTVQTYVVALQNAVDRSELGVATAANQFCRSIGGALAVAAYGTLLVTRLGTELAHRAVGNVDPEQLLRSPAAARQFPPAVVEGVRGALSASLHWVFLGTVPLVVAAAVTAFLLKEVPLRTESHVELPTEAEGAYEAAR
jgi:hypothetical protein